MSVDRMKQDQQANTKTDGGAPKVYATVKEIKSNVANIFRVVDPDGYKKCWKSWIICDDGKKRAFIIENDIQGKGLLARLIGDRDNFFRGGILESVKGNSGKEFLYEKSHPELFQLVQQNGDATGKSGSWRGKKEFVFNVIDRDMETDDSGRALNWCQENKHTKLIKMGATAFDSLVDTRDNDGNLEDYDLNYQKKGSGLETTHSIRRAGAASVGVVSGPMSTLEKSYEKYNTEKETQLASAYYIMKYLTQRFKDCDEAMGTKFFEELSKQAEIEKAEWEKNGGKPYAEDKDVEDSVVHSSEPVSTKAPTNSKEDIKPSSGKIVPCESCGKDVDASAVTCPNCKTTRLAPCDKCNKVISAFAKVCPECGNKFE